MTRQSPSLSSINASAWRRNSSLMLSGSAAGSHGNDLAVLSFMLLRERGIARSGQLSLIVIFEDSWFDSPFQPREE